MGSEWAMKAAERACPVWGWDGKAKPESVKRVAEIIDSAYAEERTNVEALKLAVKAGLNMLTTDREIYASENLRAWFTDALAAFEEKETTPPAV